MHALALALSLTAAAPGAAAAAPAGRRPQASLSLVERLYYEGRYSEALQLIRELRTAAPTGDSMVALLRYQSFVLYLLALPEQATAVWRELLALRPDYRLSTDDVTPEMVEFFNAVTPSAAFGPASLAALAPEAAAPTPGEALAAPAPRGCGIVLCLVPLGVGQFANDQPLKGALFAALQAGALAVNLGLYWDRYTELTANHGSFRDRGAAEAKLVAQRVAFVSIFILIAAGIGDAFVFP